MADKWVDISDGSEPLVPAYTGSGHVGDTLDPFSWDDFIVDPKSSNRYFLREWKVD